MCEQLSQPLVFGLLRGVDRVAAALPCSTGWQMHDRFRLEACRMLHNLNLAESRCIILPPWVLKKDHGYSFQKRGPDFRRI